MKIKIATTTLQAGNSTTNKYQIEIRYEKAGDGKGLSEADANALAEAIIAEAGDNYNESEHITVWHHAGVISLGCRDLPAAMVVLDIARRQTGYWDAQHNVLQAKLRYDAILAALASNPDMPLYSRNSRGQICKLL